MVPNIVQSTETFVNIPDIAIRMRSFHYIIDYHARYRLVNRTLGLYTWLTYQISVGQLSLLIVFFINILDIGFTIIYNDGIQ